MSKILFFIVGFLATSNAIPELILYNERLPTVSTFQATTNVGSDNQLCLPPQIKATRVCANTGIWIFYPDTNFLADRANASILATGVAGPQICMALPAHLDKAVGSYRPAGDPAGSICSLNLYVNKDYAATERLANDSTPAIPFAFNSAIRSGDCEWQFFMKENFDGFSECLRGTDPINTPLEFFVPDFTKKFGVQAGDIKSIRQGCTKSATKLNPSHIFNGYDGGNYMVNNQRL